MSSLEDEAQGSELRRDQLAARRLEEQQQGLDEARALVREFIGTATRRAIPTLSIAHVQSVPTGRPHSSTYKFRKSLGRGWVIETLWEYDPMYRSVVATRGSIYYGHRNDKEWPFLSRLRADARGLNTVVVSRMPKDLFPSEGFEKVDWTRQHLGQLRESLVRRLTS